MKTIAISGSSGFIGNSIKNSIKNNYDNFKIIEIDLKSGYDLSIWDNIKNIESFDTFIHLAAKSYVPDSYKNPKLFYDTNFATTLNALELCRKHNAKMILASSYVYGTPKYLPIDEDHPVNAFNPYAQSKLISEDLCRAYNRDFGLPVIIFRPFNIYGYGQDKNFLIPKIISDAKNGKIFLENSLPKRDFLHIDDLVEAFIKAITYEKTNYEIFNIGYGDSLSVSEITEKIIKKINKNISVSFSKKKRKNEILETKASITKAKELLNWSPRTNFECGIKKMLKKYFENDN